MTPVSEVQQAAEGHLSVYIEYTDRQGDVSLRDIIPFAAYEARGTVYIHAYCLLRDDRRTFRLDDIDIRRVSRCPCKDWQRKLAVANADVPVYGKRIF